MSNPYASPEQSNASLPSLTFVQSVRGMQVVTGALAIGSLVIWGVMLTTSGAAIDGKPDVIAWMGLGMAGVMIVAHLVIPSVIINTGLLSITSQNLVNATPEEKQTTVLAPIRTGHIIACAMLEGAAVFNAIAYMIEHYLGNIIAGGILIVLIVMKTPTVFGLQNKVTDRLREIEIK